MKMPLKPFHRHPGTYLAEVARNNSAIDITFHGRDYATVVSTSRWRQAQQAEDIVNGLLKLARRNADLGEYQAYAEALKQMAHSGTLELDDKNDEQLQQEAQQPAA